MKYVNPNERIYKIKTEDELHSLIEHIWSSEIEKKQFNQGLELKSESNSIEQPNRQVKMKTG